MRQPNRLPQTNVLPFPRARFEENSSRQLRESQGGDYRAGDVERSARLALQRHGILDDYFAPSAPLYGPLLATCASEAVDADAGDVWLRDAAARRKSRDHAEM